MNDNNIDKDTKDIERRRKIFRVIGIIGSIIAGICVLMTAFADDFSIEALLLFLICLIMAIGAKKK